MGTAPTTQNTERLREAKPRRALELYAAFAPTIPTYAMPQPDEVYP